MSQERAGDVSIVARVDGTAPAEVRGRIHPFAKVDRLTFAEHVDSPTATKLPVLRKVALLKDANGVIDIRLPISGSLDDPEFSVRGLFTQQIVDLLTKAATAPFTLLPKAFGSGGELSTVTFARAAQRSDPTQRSISPCSPRRSPTLRNITGFVASGGPQMCEAMTSGISLF